MISDLSLDLLFTMYINDWDVNINVLFSKFADHTKIGGVADSEEGCQIYTRI